MLQVMLNVDVWERVGLKNNRMSHHTDVTISKHDTSTRGQHKLCMNHF